jgi:hypothetical protein
VTLEKEPTGGRAPWLIIDQTTGIARAIEWHRKDGYKLNPPQAERIIRVTEHLHLSHT